MRISKNDWFILLPLLVFHALFILLVYSSEITADEGRYLSYAENLTNGFYTTKADPVLRNGPGYPLFLAPLVLLGLERLVMVLSNAFLIYVGTVYLFKALKFYLPFKRSVVIAVLVSFYPVILRWEYLTNSESLTFMLSSLFVYHLACYYSNTSKNKNNLIYSAIFLGLLTLTKVLFGYLLLIGAVTCIIWRAISRKKSWMAPSLLFSIALAVCIPYLAYTYSLTGNFFYWGSQGGELLYWRSTPYPNEYGDWIDGKLVTNRSSSDQYFNLSDLRRNHGEFYANIANLSNIEKDQAFKAQAIENIKQYPLQYIKNTVASALRIFYNYPYSYTPQKFTTYLYIIPNTFLVVSLALSIGLIVLNKEVSRPEIVIFLAITMIYLGGITLLNGKPRHFLPVLPLTVIFISYAMNNFLDLKHKKSII